MIHLIGSKHSGHGPDGRRLYFKGGGGGGQVKYDNLERLYDEQAASARLLRNISEQNLPGATQAYVGEVQNVLAPDYANRQANMAGADMAGANAMERAAVERNLASMGVNPNDPRFAGSMRATQLNNAARMAAGKNISRNEADQFQLNVAKDAVGTFTGQSNNAATQMGNAASGLGSVYNSQSQQKAMQDQQQSSAIGNAVAGGLMAYSMFKDGGKVRGIGGLRTLSRKEYDRIAEGDGVEQHAAGGNVGQSYDDYAATQASPTASAGRYQGITPEQWSAAAAPKPDQQAQSAPTFGEGLYYDKSGAVRYVGQNDAMFGPRFLSSRMSPELRAAKLSYAGLTALPSAQMKDGGKVVERHMLGGRAGSQQGMTGMSTMPTIAPPPSFQAPQQQQQSPINMQTIQTAQKIKKGGGMQGAAQRTTDKLGQIAGKFSDSAGNQIQSHAAGMGMDASQANAAADAYVQAAKSATDPKLAQTYMDTAANIQAGAGGQLGAAPVAEAMALNPATGLAEGTTAALGEAGVAAGTEQAAMLAAQDAAMAGAGAAAEGVAGAAAAEGVAAAGAEAAATGLGTAAGALGTALPWLGAAYAVGSLFDWWNEGGQVGDQNRGMSEAEARKRFVSAFNEGEVNDLREGGPVPGEWVENRDTVPALLVEEEVVLNAEAAKLVGDQSLEQLNAEGLKLREQGVTPNQIKPKFGIRKKGAA